MCVTLVPLVICVNNNPNLVALLPYTIFSLFHALTFTRTTLMPHFFPPGPPLTNGGPPQPHPMAKRLQVWVKGSYACLHSFYFTTYLVIRAANYDNAMRIVAMIELIIFVRVVLGTITFQNSLLSPIFFAHFLRQRYYQSPFTREAFAIAVARIDKLAFRPGNPPMISRVWTQTKALVSRWVGTVLEPQDPPRRD
jgi:transmembrane protein 33